MASSRSSPDLFFSYDMDPDNFPIPAPVLAELYLSNPVSPSNSDRLQVRGLVDSGADGTAIDGGLVTRLNLPQVDEVELSVVTDEGEDSRVVPVVSVRLTLGDLYDEVVRVMALPRLAENDVLLGRDLLNEWFIELWGPSFSGSISLSPR